MQQVNAMIVGNGNSVDLFKKSKFLNKLYTTSDHEISGTLRIMFNTFQELADKCKALQVDLVVVEDENWILQGIGDVMKQNYINCFAPTSKWTNLKLSHHLCRAMLQKYQIQVPPSIALPTEFPVLVKGDGVLKKANSLQEIIAIKERVFNTSPEIAKTIFIEKYIDCEKHRITSLYDGKNLYTFPNTVPNPYLVSDYTEKLKNMLVKENADFIGFINSELIQDNETLYNTGINYKFIPPNTDKDIIFILLSAIYQKLDELDD